ncbi:MAG: insulinase family protein [Limosilactobacillus sp.]|nr:insulinase family protein [Limosilactobacillus sp.]
MIKVTPTNEVVSQTLANGLQVKLYPMPDYHKTYAILTTNFGSVDRRYRLSDDEDWIEIPDGMAHFLEHKMFEKADYDAFEKFGQYGADANAFTSFTQTSYLFSTTQNLHENLDVLLDFVQTPYFSADSVAKEQGIIGQEIKMYADNPGNRLYMGMMGNLYPNDPMHIDIAGTVASISQITADKLYDAYRAFYQPQNMTLLVVGQLDPSETLTWIEQNQAAKTFATLPLPQRDQLITDPTGADVIAKDEVKMDVQRSKVMVGLRGTYQAPTGKERLRYKSAVELGLELLFDDTSDNYLRLYNEGVLDDSFNFSFEIERGFHFASFAREAEDRARFTAGIKQVLTTAHERLLASEEQFTAIKNATLGRLIFNLDSPEAIANRFEGELFDQAMIFDEIATLASISFTEMVEATMKLIAPMRLTQMVVAPLAD